MSSQLGEAYCNIPVGSALDYNLPAPPALPTAKFMACAVAGSAQDSVGHDITTRSSIPGDFSTNNTGSQSISKSAHYDRRMVFIPMIQMMFVVPVMKCMPRLRVDRSRRR